MYSALSVMLAALPLVGIAVGAARAGWVGAVLGLLLGVIASSLIGALVSRAEARQSSAPRPYHEWLPGWWARVIFALVVAPLAYGLVLTLLHLAAPEAAAAWVRPSLPLIQAWLPIATPILSGHAAEGHPIYGMVNAHLLAVGHVAGAGAWVFGIGAALRHPAAVAAMLRRWAAARQSSWATRLPLWAKATAYLLGGSGVLWFLALRTDVLAPTGGFTGGRNSAAMPGLFLVAFAQFGWLMVLGAGLYVVAWISGSHDPTSTPSERHTAE